MCCLLSANERGRIRSEKCVGRGRLPPSRPQPARTSRPATFHGGSYGTLLGGQYAETYPRHVRAMVLESVIDHSVPTTRDFLHAEAATAQDSFQEFVKWCQRATDCALHD